MNSIRKKVVPTIYLVSSIALEIILVYLIVNSALSKDYISPHEVTFYEFLKLKLSNIV